ncbi:AraC family transcriptional regulator [Paenibacillus sp. GYB004]|uniref:AraC family transcriptional regulator n=1 Tax=Paenibacillus sp. GYB004 TaxID=2994393 RepID=UPI002F96B679
MYMRISTDELELWRIENEFTNHPHSHDEQIQITIPIQGTCHFTHEQRSYSLDSGNSLIQYPRENHHFRIGGDSSVIIIQLQADRLEYNNRPVELMPRHYVDPQDVLGQFRDWTSRLLARDPSDRLSVQETECSVVSYLSRVFGDRSDPLSERPDRRLIVSDPYMTRVLDYIHDHFRTWISVDDLAALALQSRYHFIRSFKSATGMSPYQYVMHTRIEEAKRKLRSTSMSVTEIAMYLGFSSASQLYRAFMNAVGTTPERYRK